MSRTRIVKGTYTKISGGGHSMYCKENINSSAGKQVTENGCENGVFYKNPETPKKTDKVYDVVMFVAGTTDPLNKSGLKHEANTGYWRDKDAKNNQSKESFWAKVKELGPQFQNLYIEGNFYSWSGDNDTNERNLAAERLLDLLSRVYHFNNNQEVSLHLIGHSHGGNVINQFTELITNKAMIAKSEFLKKRNVTGFPEHWKIKSITYLSTPFFQKKHQLNHGKLHKECKIINVHNGYDLTQQLVADFSLVNLEGLIKSFAVDNFALGIKMLKEFNIDVILTYAKSFIWQDFDNRAIAARKEMAKAAKGINLVTQELIKYIDSIKINNSNLQKEKASFIGFLRSFLQWSYDVYTNYSNGSKNYGKAKFVADLNLTKGVKVLNILFAIKSNPKDSYLLSLLGGVFGENKGITDSIDETSWNPKKQTKKLSILDVPIFDKDPYNTRSKKSQFDNFLKGAQNAVHTNNLEEMLMRLFSQFINPDSFASVVKIIDYLVEPFVFGKLDTEVTILRKNMAIYSELVTKYNAHLVAEKDKNIKALDQKPGSVVYLATTSHSLSHTQFWKEVENGLKAAFSSPKSSHYKKT
ncbi:hypothetical protein IV494_00010 [Kaistella sp. G5-32]|uniref:Alpha/beta hydrolase family protein DUF900 n=1 Tax=Kaistella gelatinilytica TaxID=2787636 RepID=A0ABS0F799_9FLAO|nr:hypothetical protein [Kaistella gelatinilytica]MBF8455551.1 hypothetical protein [Kaistella gelatinilytica]